MARALRQDAAERREAILAAAEIAFAEKGFNVPLEEVCTAAGVGRATLYRNFENRLALVHAIMSNNLDKLDRLVLEVGERPNALAAYLAEVLDQQVKTGGLVYLIGRDVQLDQNLTSRFKAHLAQLLDQAKAADLVRSDVTADTVAIAVRMMWGGLDGLSFADRKRSAPTVYNLCLAAIGLRQVSGSVEQRA